MKILKTKPMSYWRGIAVGAGCFEAMLDRFRQHGMSGGRAILLGREIDPEGFNHWSEHEREFFDNEKRVMRKFSGVGPSPRTLGFRFIGR